MYISKGKWKHRLSNINPVLHTAFCSNCGSVRVRVKSRKGIKIRWRCCVADNRWHYEAGKRYRDFLKSKCEVCGFVPKNTCQLDVHHKDGNHENNREENLQTVCANCHRLQGVELL
jgi:Zn finger protein HypA/HybF involved in hydrogenase expression